MQDKSDDSLLDQVHTQLVSEFSKTLEMFNLSTSEARLFATLYVNKFPMTLDEMGEALGKSKTSMSTGIRSLLDANLVERVWKKGERKDYYRAKENLYHKMVNSYLDKWIESVDRQKKSLQNLENMLSDKSVSKLEHDDINFLRNRIREMIDFHQLIEETFQV